MIGKYAKLKNGWVLRGWIGAPMTVASLTSGDVRQLNQKEFYVAKSCDGKTDFDSLAFLYEHQSLLDVLIKEGIAEECQEGNSIESYQQYRKAHNPFLTGIHWCVTGRCNLNCRHCYMESPSGRYNELPFDNMAKLIEQFDRANVLRVSLTGGEPFLRKDIMDIIRLLAKKKLWLSHICTNGLLITQDHLKEIKRIGFSPSFQISFDGIDAHDYMRGVEGIESEVIEGIRRVHAAGFSVIVATSIDQMNIGRLDDTYELIKGLGVRAWRIARPHKLGNWRGTTTGLSLDEMAKACAPLLGHWIRDNKPFYIELAGFYRGGQASKSGMSSCDPLYESRNPDEEERPEYTPDSYDCVSCRERPNLLPDGTLVPCPGYVDSVMQSRMPNLLHEDLSTVWTKSFLREIADLKKKDLLTNSECISCEMFKVCGAGCRASALMETGDLMAKDPVACEMWKRGFKKYFQELARMTT